MSRCAKPHHREEDRAQLSDRQQSSSVVAFYKCGAHCMFCFSATRTTQQGGVFPTEVASQTVVTHVQLSDDVRLALCKEAEELD
eukprot:5964847-Amphidinium_carterae.2